MGNNSGSMHNLAAIDDHHFHQRLVGQHHQHNSHHQHLKQHQLHHQHQLQLQQQLQQQQQQWTTQSMPRAMQPQIKVLPDSVPGVKVLRTTNNGAILNSGGTLTNRKDGPGVQRSKSISAPHHNLPPHPNMMAMRQRSTTQINMIEEREQRMTNYKRFGSEPDLRMSGDEENVNQAAQKGRAKILKGKKKKAAPAPPPIKQPEGDYDPARFGWKPKQNGYQPQPSPPMMEPPQRKSRLFKTKAESKKTTIQTKITSEASDHFSREKESFRVIEQHPRESFMLHNLSHNPNHNHIEDDRMSDDQEWKQSRARIIPMPQFRREKSFDVTLLSERSNQIENYLHNRRQRVPSPLQAPTRGSKQQQHQQQQNYSKPNVKNLPEPPKNLRKIKEDSKEKLRKTSQAVRPNQNSGSSSGVSSFQKELLAATKRRSEVAEQNDKVMSRPIETMKPLPRTKIIKKEIVITPSHNQPLQKTTKVEPKITTKEEIKNVHSKNVAVVKTTTKEITPPEPKTKAPELKLTKTVEKELMPVRKTSTNNITPAKTFYFGMDENAEPEMVDTIMDKTQLDVIDRFAESLMKRKPIQRHNESSESALSSDIEENFENNIHDGHRNDNESQGISLQLRPTLPKKQFEIPRFSPSAAWRLLSAEEDMKESSKFYHPEKFNLEPLGVRQHHEIHQNGLEDRIERIYREPVPGIPDNKSGDSGISGDAGLPERDDSPRQNGDMTSSSQNIKPYVSTWTPQQDLEESSSDEAHVSEGKDLPQIPENRGHLFSLSLPRESHLSHVSDKSDKQSFKTNSLQKLKKTVSNAFHNHSTNERSEHSRSDNWLLSRSQPNSIDNIQAKPPRSHSTKTSDPEDFDQSKLSPSHLANTYNTPIMIQPSFGYLSSGKHMMYLPNHPIGESSDYKTLERHDNFEKSPHAKESMREDLQDPPEFNDKVVSDTHDSNNNSHLQLVQLFQEYHKPAPKTKNHRFTFQSTVRQIERRRIADKLSKEAEHKEAQRLSELEAMRRVEEEFQKKRAREKASIRQQLRLYSMEENQCLSLPVDWNENSRAEPDGAVSSPTESPHLNINEGDNFDLGKYETDDYVDTKTPYISRIVEQKSSKYRVDSQQRSQPPQTEVLSEFHTTRREYMDYRNNRRPESPAVSSSSGQRSHTTEHPQVTCNIPASRGPSNGFGFEDDLPITDNYRRDFALGGRSINSSDSEVSGPSLTGNGGKKIMPSRSRSPSPIRLTSRC